MYSRTSLILSTTVGIKKVSVQCHNFPVLIMYLHVTFAVLNLTSAILTTISLVYQTNFNVFRVLGVVVIICML